jgi:hypothetical protein
MVKRGERKAPEINLGYYARVMGVRLLIHKFFEAHRLVDANPCFWQSCGSGFGFIYYSFINFFYVCGSFLPCWIRIRIANPDLDCESGYGSRDPIETGSDPNPQHWFSASASCPDLFVSGRYVSDFFKKANSFSKCNTVNSGNFVSIQTLMGFFLKKSFWYGRLFFFFVDVQNRGLGSGSF